MAAMWTLLSVFLCISAVRGEDETCATCGQSPPAQSAALLQSSVQRNSKTAVGPHVFSPAQLFGPGPMGRHVSQAQMGRMGPRMGPHPHQRMSQPHFSFEQRRAGGQSKGESLYGGAVLTPCQDPSAWTPEKDIAGWCDMYSMPVQPDAATCDAGDGCRYSYGYCYCDKKEGCNAVGGTWNPYTCKKSLEDLPATYIEKIEEAKRAGTCEGFDVQGYKVKDMVAWPATQCCTDAPSSMCEHNVQPMNPCKNQAAFLPDAYAYAYCDTSEVNPSKEQCEAVPGCKEEHGWCQCHSKCACELLGGHFWGMTCQEEVKNWYPGAHKGVKEALDKGTCAGVEVAWGDIKYQAIRESLADLADEAKRIGLRFVVQIRIPWSCCALTSPPFRLCNLELGLRSWQRLHEARTAISSLAKRTRRGRANLAEPGVQRAWQQLREAYLASTKHSPRAISRLQLLEEEFRLRRKRDLEGKILAQKAQEMRLARVEAQLEALLSRWNEQRKLSLRHCTSLRISQKVRAVVPPVL